MGSLGGAGSGTNRRMPKLDRLTELKTKIRDHLWQIHSDARMANDHRLALDALGKIMELESVVEPAASRPV